MAGLGPEPGRVIGVRRFLAALLVSALLVVAAGCGGDDDQKTPGAGASGSPGAAAPSAGVQPDGSYVIGPQPNGDTAKALQAAVDALPLAVSFDHRSLDDTLTRATATMTPTFADEFRRIFDGSTRAKAIREQAITTALVRGAGVVDRIESGRVTVLIYVDQILVASKLLKKDSPLKVTQNSVRVKMQKVDGVWKVDGIEPF